MEGAAEANTATHDSRSLTLAIFEEFPISLLEGFTVLQIFRNIKCHLSSTDRWLLCLTMRLCQKQLRCQVVWGPQDTFTFYRSSSSSNTLWSPERCAGIPLIRGLKRWDKDSDVKQNQLRNSQLQV